jgi:hypothetical protein
MARTRYSAPRTGPHRAGLGDPSGYIGDYPDGDWTGRGTHGPGGAQRAGLSLLAARRDTPTRRLSANAAPAAGTPTG